MDEHIETEIMEVVEPDANVGQPVSLAPAAGSGDGLPDGAAPLLADGAAVHAVNVTSKNAAGGSEVAGEQTRPNTPAAQGPQAAPAATATSTCPDVPLAPVRASRAFMK